MFEIFIPCIIVCYLYHKTYILENKIQYLQFELNMINRVVYENSLPNCLLLE
jgi:hypothetical protein